MRKLLNVLAAALLAASVLTGCASHSKTVTHETVKYPSGGQRYSDGTVRYPDGTIRYPDGRVQYPDGTVRYEQPPVKEETTTTEQEGHHEGVLSTTLDFIGDVIAFPFRLVGSVISAIF